MITIISRIVPFVILFGLLQACSSLENKQANDPVSTSIAQTLTFIADQQIRDTQNVQPVREDPTIQPTYTLTDSTLTPTEFISPTPLNLPIDSINFPFGGTSRYYNQPLQAGFDHYYLVRADEGQTMILTVSSPDNDVFLSFGGYLNESISPLISTASTDWNGTLPTSQDYLITLSTNNPFTKYFFTIEIPMNIQFQPDSDSTSIDGYIDVDTTFHPDVMTRVRYLVSVSEGETMIIELDSPTIDNLSLGVIGQEDGQSYLSARVKNAFGQVVSPFTQNYYIDVYAINGVSTDFTLQITIN
jgi:hypothetical protein